MLIQKAINQKGQAKREYFKSVKKRDGSVVQFDKNKITDAIFKAAVAVGGEDRIMAEELAEAVALFLRKKFGTTIPSIEEIQDVVEKVLIETGHAKTAKAYILYREKRTHARRALRVRKKVEAKADTTDMSLLVTPMAKDEITPWDKSKIAQALVKEAGLSSELAADIASSVEKKIISSDHRQISTTLIRELVDNELFERGLSAKLKRQAIIGMPTFDLENLILSKSNENSNISTNNPEAVNLCIAETTLKQYALQRIFSEDVANAHMKGMIHLHDLGYPTRVYCSSHSLEYIKKYGLKLGGLDTHSAPAKYARTLTGHLNTFLASMQAYYAGALGVGYINIMYAPYLEGMSDYDLKQEAQYLIYSSSQNAFSRGGQSLFIDHNVHTGVPNYLKEIPAIGPKGEYTGKTYGYYEKTAQKFARALLDIWRQGDKNGKPFAFPKCDFHINDDTFKDPAQRELLEYACQVASENGAPYFVFDRNEVTLSACCRLRTEIKDNYMIQHPESMRFSFPRYESVIIKENNIIKSISFEKFFSITDSPVQREDDFEIKYCNNIKVWDAEGWVDLIKVVRHRKANKALRTIFTSTGHCITTTADHPIPCSLEHANFTCSKCGSSELFRNGNAKYGAAIFCCSSCGSYRAADVGILDLELKNAADIPENALLNYAGYPIVEYKYAPIIKTRAGHNFVTPAIAYLLGLYIGDGCIAGGSIQISSNAKELREIGHLLDIEGIKYSIYKDRKSKKLAIHDTNLVRFIKDKLMAGSSSCKQLPIDIMHWEDSLVRYLIAGIIDADGFIHRKSIEIVISSKTVLSQVQMLLHTKGFYSSLSYRKEDLTPNRYNNYDIKQKNAYFLLRIPCTRQLKAWLACSFKARKAEVVSNYMVDKERRGLGCYVKNNSKTFSENEEWVYDITTNSGTLSLNGIQVHNCGFQNITINLPQAAYRAGKGNINGLYKEIEHCMDLAIKAHLQKKEFIGRLMAEPGLPLWEIGKTALDGRPYVDLTKATYIIGIIGLDECVQFLTGKQLHEDEEVFKLGLKIISFMYFKAKETEQKLGLNFSLEESPAESATRRLAKVDLKSFPESDKVIKGDLNSDTYYYTNSIHFAPDAPIDLVTRIQKQSKFHTMIESGAIIHAFVGEKLPSAKSIMNLVEKTYYNTQAAQITISPEFTICNNCSKVELGLKAVCANCGSEDVYGVTRIVGYYSKINNWNRSKLGELVDRRRHTENYRVVETA